MGKKKILFLRNNRGKREVKGITKSDMDLFPLYFKASQECCVPGAKVLGIQPGR